MAIPTTTFRVPTSKWTKEEDHTLLTAIDNYNKTVLPSSHFTKNPFNKDGSFTTLKGWTFSRFLKIFLPNFSRNRKQIRERYRTVLCPEVIVNIKEEHKPILLDLCEQYGNSWETISRLTYDTLFNQKGYYSGNSIKNLFNARRKIHISTLKKTENTESKAEFSSKKRKFGEVSTPDSTSSSSLSQEEVTFVLSCLEDGDNQQASMEPSEATSSGSQAEYETPPSPFSEEDFDFYSHLSWYQAPSPKK